MQKETKSNIRHGKCLVVLEILSLEKYGEFLKYIQVYLVLLLFALLHSADELCFFTN